MSGESSDEPAAPAPATARLAARHVTKHYLPPHGRRHRRIVAVDDVSLELRAGRVTALVGESGSGKSTLARLLALLESPTEGDVVLAGEPVRPRRPRAMRPFRSQVQLMLQDPFSSLNPLHTVRYTLRRPLLLHGMATAAQADRQVDELLCRVQLTPPERFAFRLPHELSGGQRQRVALARAMAVAPAVLLADEPVSMLDVSIRVGVLHLLLDLVRREDLALLYITHDIASARYAADEVLVMYAGRVVERGGAEAVTQSPAHPYTRLLVSSVPGARVRGRSVPASTDGTAALATSAGSGCRFAPRCPEALERCWRDRPPAMHLGGGHWSACWLREPDLLGPSERA